MSDDKIEFPCEIDEILVRKLADLDLDGSEETMFQSGEAICSIETPTAIPEIDNNIQQFEGEETTPEPHALPDVQVSLKTFDDVIAEFKRNKYKVFSIDDIAPNSRIKLSKSGKIIYYDEMGYCCSMTPPGLIGLIGKCFKENKATMFYRKDLERRATKNTVKEAWRSIMRNNTFQLVGKGAANAVKASKVRTIPSAQTVSSQQADDNSSSFINDLLLLPEFNSNATEQSGPQFAIVAPRVPPPPSLPRPPRPNNKDFINGVYNRSNIKSPKGRASKATTQAATLPISTPPPAPPVFKLEVVDHSSKQRAVVSSEQSKIRKRHGKIAAIPPAKREEASLQWPSKLSQEESLPEENSEVGPEDDESTSTRCSNGPIANAYGITGANEEYDQILKELQEFPSNLINVRQRKLKTETKRALRQNVNVLYCPKMCCGNNIEGFVKLLKSLLKRHPEGIKKRKITKMARGKLDLSLLWSSILRRLKLIEENEIVKKREARAAVKLKSSE